jgi:hypothetical protein
MQLVWTSVRAYYFKTNSNAILQSTPSFSKWSPPLRLSTKSLVFVPSPPHRMLHTYNTARLNLLNVTVLIQCEAHKLRITHWKRALNFSSLAMPWFGSLHATITYIFDLLFSFASISNTKLSVTDDRYQEAAVQNSIHAFPHISYQSILKLRFNFDILSSNCYENLTGELWGATSPLC